MGAKTGSGTVTRRNGGHLSRSSMVRFATLIAVIGMAVVIQFGGGNAYISLPGFQNKSDTSADTEASPAAPAMLRQFRADRVADDGPNPVLGQAAQVEARVDPVLANEEPPVQAPGTGTDRDDEDEGAPIHGSVLDDAGEPLPERVVTAERLDVGSAAIAGGNRARAVTDQLGMFSFQPLPGDEYLLRVAEDEDFHAGRQRVRVGVSAAEIYLQRKGSIEISGQVLDEMTTPLVGVQVRSLGSRQTAVSDQNGHYRIEVDRVRPGTAPVLEFRHAQHQDVRERIEGAAGANPDPVRLDVVMPGRNDTVSVSGWVSGPASEPISGAAVWLSTASPPAHHRTRTDSLGAYEFPQVDSSEHYRLGVEPIESDYQRYVSKARAIGGDHVNHDVRLKKAGDAEISGVLVDPLGRPLPGFGIWLRQLDGGAPSPVFIQADQQGEFPPVKVGSGALRLESRSSPQLEAGGIHLAAGETRFMQIPLDWGSRWLMGQVVDEADRPVQRARVVVQWHSRGAEVTSSSRRAVRVDQGGFFSFANLGAAHYQLTVSAPGFQTRRIQVSPTAGDEILVPMQRQSPSAGGRP